MRNSAWYRGIIANLLTMACHMSVVTLLPLYWRRSGLEDGEIGWIAAGFSIAAILARTRLGDWLEARGRRPFLFLGSLLLTTMALAFPYWGLEFWPWFGLRLLQGAGYAFYITAVLTWVADLSPPDRIGQAQGVFGVSGLLGSAVGPMTAESIYKLYGFPAMFTAVGATGMVAVALMASLPETRVMTDAHSKLARKPIALRDHRAMLCVTIPFGYLVGTVITFIAPYSDSVGLPSVALYFVGFALASISVRLGSGGFIDNVRPARLVQVSGGLLGLSGLTLACLQAYPYTAVLFAAAILNGVGHGFLFPGLSAYTVRKTPAWQRGAGIALFTGVFDTGVLIGSVVSGYICQDFGYTKAYLLAALILLSSLPIFGRFDDSQEPIDPSELRVDPQLGDVVSL